MEAYDFGDTSEIVNAITDMVNKTISEIDVLTLLVEPGYEDWVTWTPEKYSDDSTHESYDIIADKQDGFKNTGYFNIASDEIYSTSVPGFVAPVPDLITSTLPSFCLIVLAGYIAVKKRIKL